MTGYDQRDPGSVEQGATDYSGGLGEPIRGLRVGVLRHTWEEDVPANPDLHAAMEDALYTLRALGATLEECRVRTLRDYNDVKIVIAESEIVNVHLDDLRRRPLDFGTDIRSRMLPALLFTAQDYVTATREHRLLVIDTLTLHDRFDVLIMAGQGEAPTFTAHHRLNFWRRVNACTLANVTGQPALALPIGFGANGLPLGMQILARPFADATVLRVGHAYQGATSWHRNRASMIRGQVVPPIVATRVPAVTVDDADARTRDLCVRAAGSAGIELDDVALAQMLEGAPFALSIKARQERRHSYTDVPSVAFRPVLPLPAMGSDRRSATGKAGRIGRRREG